MDSSAPLRQYRSSTAYRDNRQGLGGTSREMWEKRAVAVGDARLESGLVTGTRATDGNEGAEENKCDALHRGGQSRKCLCKSEQPARCAHQFKRTVRLSLPPARPASFHLPISFFSSSSSAFVWSSTTRYPHPKLPLSLPRPYNPIGVESRLAGRGKMGRERRGRETR